MSDRCELSDLPTDQCACRIHGPQEEIPPGNPVGHAFSARFPGQCLECREDITIGDCIVASPLVAGGYVHEECS